MKLTRCNPTNSSPAVPSTFQGFLRPSFAGLTAFDQLFDLAGFPAFKATAPAAASTPAVLAVDVYEDEGHYYARFEVPGVKKDDAKVELEERRLTVTVSRKTQTSEGETSLEMSRALTVPEGIEVEKISAKIEDGLLTVILPKAEIRKPRVIELN